MVTAEQWLTYQQQYGKSIFEGGHKPVLVSSVKKGKTSPKDRFMLMLLTILAGLICVGLIIASAYAASIKVEINNMLADNDRIKGEIENINVAIKSAVNIGNIEDRAINELGMVYPEFTQYRYLVENQDENYNLASLIKAKAYN